MLKLDVIYDQSHQSLESVPMRVLDMCNLQMLYLEGNDIELLPDDLFTRLPKLNWLDLRNNQLRKIPTTIANHNNLENLLLEQNQLGRLPNELGLVPTLVVLQLGKNPLTYPKKKIIDRGTQAICTFLKREYNKEHNLANDEPSEESVTTDESRTTIRRLKAKKKKEKIPIRELLRRASCNLEIENMPSISIRSLSAAEQQQQSENNEIDVRNTALVLPLPVPRKLPKITRYCSKLSIRSHYNSNKYVGVRKCRSNEQRVMDHGVKEIWMNKLQELLTFQEKSLQQERNLQALSSWRTMKKLEPPRKVEAGGQRVEVPYDTNPNYSKMLSRNDLNKDVERIEKMLRRRQKNGPTKQVDIQKLVNELVSQLKMLERSTQTNQAGGTDLRKSEKEIQKIIELHKRVTELQQKNQSTW